MALFVHRAERADHLVAGLAELLAEPLPDPFADEVVAVPAKGIERWLTQQLAHRLGSSRTDGIVGGDGICAGVRFPSPAALIDEIVGAGQGDPYEPDRLVWPLLAEIDGAVGEDWCRTLTTHLGVGQRGDEREYRQGRRYAVARRLAALYSGYAAQRPELIEAWTAGDDTDGLSRPVADDLRWQAELWRRTVARIGRPDPVVRPVLDLATILPQRVSIFGPTRLPAAQLTVLGLLAEDRDVHLWLPHPSPALWDRIAASHPPHRPRRVDDPTAELPDHPLLSSLGRDARELQLLLPADAVRRHHPAADVGEPATLLHRLQADIRDNRRPDGSYRVRAGDRSVQVHACHGPSRQVEVLREALVGLLDADPTLEPRDVIVMCPDIEVYAPLVAAAFGLGAVDGVAAAHPAHRMRVRLADRALTQTNLLLGTVARLLELADSRLTGAQLLDLAAWGPVRRRFGFSDDDLAELTTWCADAGVRWGLDQEHRAAFGLGSFPQNTWRAGLDRMLVGAAMSAVDRRSLGLALPLDDIDSGDIDRVGRLAELVDRVHTAVSSMRGTRPLSAWLSALTDAVLSITRLPDSESWQLGELQQQFESIREAADPEPQLRLPDVRALLAGRLGGRPTRSNFRTGNLTVCTMVPMRSVPHRVVCLLGLDDGVFPRAAHPDGDDVLARDPLVGERDRRGEDRQLLLDALLAATEHLVITYSGADERTGAARPPCVPVGELLDAVVDTAADGEDVRRRIVIQHPLQPFDVRNVTTDGLGLGRPFSYDPAALAGAKALVAERHPPAPFLTGPLAARADTDLELDQLIRLLQNPAAGFLRQRLDVAVPFEEDEPAEAIPVALDALQKWGVGTRLLGDRLAGIDPDGAVRAEWLRGTVPPGPLGRTAVDEAADQVERLFNATSRFRLPERQTVDIRLPLEGWTLLGSVGGLHDRMLLTVGYSNLSAKDRLAAWVRLVALTAAQPDGGWTALTVGKGAKAAFLGPLDVPAAQHTLAQLIQVYRRGLAEPLPMPVKTAAAYADARRRLRQNEAAALGIARKEWTTGQGGFPKEDADTAFVEVWGPRCSFETLTAERPPAGEQWSDDGTRFGQLARRLWTPLLAAERLEQL